MSICFSCSVKDEKFYNHRAAVALKYSCLYICFASLPILFWDFAG